MAEGEALARIGEHLGSLYRQALATRLDAGDLNPKARAEWRAPVKKALTEDTSSRWAGAITRSVEDQYQLAMRALRAEVQHLEAATTTIARRLAAPTGARDGRVRGYRNAQERHVKARRLEHLSARLADARATVERAHPRVVVGGGRLWSVRQNLVEAGLTVEQWRDRWAAERAFFTADGETGKRHGNETIRVTPDGAVSIKVPAALAGDLGSRLALTAPVGFAHRGDEWADRVLADQAVRYDITYDPTKGRWYLDASWGYGKVETPPLEALRASRVLAVDLNADHLAAHVLDPAGNPVGMPVTVPLVVAGLPASTRSARVRGAISELIRVAKSNGCAAVAIENLNFADARTTGRETMGRGQRGKRFRRTVAGIPTAQFRDRLAGMTATAGLWVIAVDPAYTSRWGAQHWLGAVKSSDPDATRHHAASVAIGRRALGHRIRRKASGPGRGQRTTISTPTPKRPAVKDTSSEGSAPLDGRSTTSRPGHQVRGRNPAPKTVRGATRTQDSLLLTR